MQELLGAAAASGSRIELQVYPGAYHGFDRANSPIREYPEYRTATELSRSRAPTLRRGRTRSPGSAFLARFLAN
jgi:dienelactone hydrolase